MGLVVGLEIKTVSIYHIHNIIILKTQTRYIVQKGKKAYSLINMMVYMTVSIKKSEIKYSTKIDCLLLE